jgi:DNA-binding NtrC family response regulator
MKSKFSALLVHAKNDCFDTMRVVLEELSVASARARNRQEVEARLSQGPSPHLVVTEPVFPDGDWGYVTDLAAKAAEKVNVIVVSPVADMGLYMDVMTHGGFDFITDSFTVAELVHILRVALDDAAISRQTQKRAPSLVGGKPPGQLTV